MGGGVFAILGALTFAFNGIVTRRAVIKVLDATVGVLITVPMGVPFFMLILFVTGQTASIVSFSWQSYAWLSAAGILHFIVGRSLGYNCIQLVGTNITNILRRVSLLVAVILGISVLGETITWQLIVGVLLIFGGIIFAALSPEMLGNGQRVFSGIPRKVVLLAFGNGLAWGITPILVKIGLGDSGSPVAGAFISYSAATIALSISLWSHNIRTTVTGMPGRAAGLFCLISLLSSIAQLLRYTALSMAPVSVVSPLFSTTPIFQVILAFLFNRKLEVFNRPIIIGTIAVVVGSILLI